MVLSPRFASELPRLNPWWSRSNWTSHDRHLAELAELPRQYDPAPLRDIQPGTVYTLRGPRRVGKSTAVKLAIRDRLASGYPPTRIVYYTCDLLASRADLAALFAAVYDHFADDAISAPFYFFIDEAQVVPDWQLAIKYVHDTHRLRHDCVVLTGSSAHDLRRGGETLPGRRGVATRRDRLLLPMSFRAYATIVAPELVPPESGFTPRELVEATQMNSPVAAALTRPLAAANLPDLIELLERYAAIGGFPFAVAHSLRPPDDPMADLARQAMFGEMWDVVRGDLLRYHQVRDSSIPLKILERLTENLASPISWHHLSREADVANSTAQTYVNLLVDAYLFLVIQRWENGSFAHRADKKVYPIDPLIALLPAAINRRPPPPLDLPKRIESLLATMLFRVSEFDPIAAFGVPHSVLYYRTKTNKEIDFLVGATREPFEVKYQSRVDGRDTQVMAQGFGRGALISKRDLNLDGKVAVIPAALALLLLD